MKSKKIYIKNLQQISFFLIILFTLSSCSKIEEIKSAEAVEQNDSRTVSDEIREIIEETDVIVKSDATVLKEETFPSPVSPDYNAVLALDPAGYWPLDKKNIQEQALDLSKHKNHAVINHVPWSESKDALNFTGAYQWLEIPKNPAYQSPSYTMGGWIYLSSDVTGSGWPNRQGLLLIGNRHWLNKIGTQLAIRKENLIDVVSNGTKNVVGSCTWVSEENGVLVRVNKGEPKLKIGNWYHVVYAFEANKTLTELPKTPNLALNGKISASSDGGHSSRIPSMANDGKLDSHWVRWLTDGTVKENAWIQLDFPEEISINRVRLINKRSSSDPWEGAQLRFSDGSVIPFGALKDEWDGMFRTKQVNWVRLETKSNKSGRPGITEFEVYKEDFNVLEEEGVITSWMKGQEVKGTGKLYFNGELVHERENISYTPVDQNLQIGNDAYWWHQILHKSGSLDGAVRDMVWFDRSLKSDEIISLKQATEVLPDIDLPKKSSIIIDGREIELADCLELSGLSLHNALRALSLKDANDLEADTDLLVMIAKYGLSKSESRYYAVKLLNKFGQIDIATQSISDLVQVIQDDNKTQSERADAALALAEIGEAAKSSLPALIEQLSIQKIHVPVVEDWFRNALIFACIKIDTDQESTQSVLNKSFAAPLMQLVDLGTDTLLSNQNLSLFEQRLQSNDYTKAVAFYNSLPQDEREDYVSYKHPRDRDYTATAYYNGNTYKVGTGIAWQGVEKVNKKEYQAITSRLAKTYKGADKWKSPDFPHLYRVPITKISPNGEEQKIYLEGKDFILDGHDAKCRAWSIFIDEKGYLHLLGGQHNYPRPDYYIPGSWEKMGVSRKKGDPTYPRQMYWVSSRPGDITSFEFVGHGNNPRAIPADYLNYLVLVQNNNETYLYSRADAYSIQCWGVFRYNSAEQKWSTIGGDPYNMIEDAKNSQAGWGELLHDSVRTSLPDSPTGIKRMAWAWHAPFYNFCRDKWGIKFDKTGRMHVKMQIAGLDGAGYIRNSRVYAWSDDGGDSFYDIRANQRSLPLTINPSKSHNAEIYHENDKMMHDGPLYQNKDYFDLWVNLIKLSGFKMR